MLPNGLDGEATPDLIGRQAQRSAPGEVSENPSPEVLPVRYVDDGAFQRCLKEVVTLHDRLLSKLAE